MVRLAMESELEPALAGDRLHHTEGQIQALQHRPLLDVEFQIAADITLQRSSREARRIEAEIADGLRDCGTGAVAPVDRRGVQLPDHRQAAQKRHAEPDALLLGERNHFDTEAEPPPAQLL